MLRKRKTNKTTRIGSFIVMYHNLNTKTFSNGEPIYEAKNPEDWSIANKGKNPAFFVINEKKSKLTGYLYNWYAISDPRGICPEGYCVPSSAELAEIMNKKTIEFKSNRLYYLFTRLFKRKTKINLLPLGYIDSNDIFEKKKPNSAIWSSTSYDKNNAYCGFSYFAEHKVRHVPYGKNHGFFVKPIKKHQTSS